MTNMTSTILRNWDTKRLHVEPTDFWQDVVHDVAAYWKEVGYMEKFLLQKMIKESVKPLEILP